ncbi:MAG: amidohydrolase family protein [Chloroflexi bacterium]|nr:amidohydrolase family protein [Chloroflexota bacterium]
MLTGATVITMDPALPRTDAIALSGGAIVAVGAVADVLRQLGDGARVVNLGGGVIMPGFIDPHHHLFLVAAERWSSRLHGPAPRTMEALLAQVRRVAREDGGSGWLRVHGYQPLTLAERRSPTAVELDSACPDRPLHLLSRTYHESGLNNQGLNRLGWDRRSPDPPGGRIVRDRRGRPSGVLLESASFIAEAASREALLAEEDGQEWVDRAERHTLALVRAGITRIGDAAVPPAGMVLYERAAAAGRLAVTVHRFPVGSNAISEPVSEGGPTGSGNVGIPVGPAKFLADGGERCALCFTSRQVFSSVTSTLRRTLRGGLRVAAVASRGGWARRGSDGLYHTGIRVLSDGQLRAAVSAAARPTSACKRWSTRFAARAIPI